MNRRPTKGIQPLTESQGLADPETRPLAGWPGHCHSGACRVLCHVMSSSCTGNATMGAETIRQPRYRQITLALSYTGKQPRRKGTILPHRHSHQDFAAVSLLAPDSELSIDDASDKNLQRCLSGARNPLCIIFQQFRFAGEHQVKRPPSCRACLDR